MELLKYIYFLGVVYIVFSIIWFLLATIPKLILTRSISSNIENYILRSVQYYLLCSLTVLTTTASFLENNHISINNGPWFVIIGGIVLFLYLAGKMERNKPKKEGEECKKTEENERGKWKTKRERRKEGDKQKRKENHEEIGKKEAGRKLREDMVIL